MTHNPEPDAVLLTLAKIAHQSNKALCELHGDTTQANWEDAPEWQKQSAIQGVQGVLAGNTPQESHESWLAEKARMGTVYGPVKDMDATPPVHPCMVPYAELPPEQRRKDHLYGEVIRAAYHALTLPEESL